MSTHKARWTAEFNNHADALAPFTATVDGATVVTPDAPAHLTRTYASLVSIGYAKGWM